MREGESGRGWSLFIVGLEETFIAKILALSDEDEKNLGSFIIIGTEGFDY